MSAEMAHWIDECRAEARDLRVKADACRDTDLAEIMREGAALTEAAADAAMQSVDFKAWLAAGAST